MRLEKKLEITRHVLEFNMEYLNEKLLIKIQDSASGWVSARITAFGIDVLERIHLLEEESIKTKPDKGRIEKIIRWLNDNASWIIQALINLGLAS